MTPRCAVTLGVYTSLIPLVSAAGAGRPSVAAAVVALEAPAAHPSQQGPNTLASRAGGVGVRSTRLERHDASSGLEQSVGSLGRGEGPVFFAWTVPVVAQHDHNERRWADDEADECTVSTDDRIEPRSGANGSWQSTTDGATRAIVILARAMAGVVDRVSFVDARCTVEAQARHVYWMDGVQPAASVSLLAGVVAARADRDTQVRDGALAALALTDDPSADNALERFTAGTTATGLRRQAAFWLGAARGGFGARVIDRLAAHDPDDGFREHLAFVLTLTGASGTERLIDLARHDAAPRVRSQALFWLAHQAGERAAGTIAAAVDRDPDSDVRKQAVFAISQLPRDEAVPRLIALAESHRDPTVRKQAMFWLGQSGDPRALAMFERVLGH